MFMCGVHPSPHSYLSAREPKARTNPRRLLPVFTMNTPVREGETIEGSRTMRNRTLSSAQVLKCLLYGPLPPATAHP